MATYVTRPLEPGQLTATLIELAGVEKVYRNGKLEYRALRGVDLSITGVAIESSCGPAFG